MYSYLRGAYKGKSADGEGVVILETAGIGYEIIVPPIVEQQIAANNRQDDDLLLYVSAQSGRDQPWPVLFGFCTPHERAFWQLLVSVPRVGGKLAARAMVVPIDSFAQAIQEGNRAFLDGLPGITLDGADKIIASLRKKVGPFVHVATAVAPRRATSAEEDDIRDGAIQLLVNMGLKRPDAQRGVDRLLASREDITSIQDIIVEFFQAQQA